MARGKKPTLSVVGEDGIEAPAHQPSWWDYLIFNDNGSPKTVIANALHVIRSHPEWRGILWYDQFHLQTFVKGKLPWCEAPHLDEEWTSQHDILATEWIQHKGIMSPLDMVGLSIEAVAKQRPFHPVREFLESLTWDGVPRLDRWMIKFLGAEDSAYIRAVGAKWLMSAVARVFDPGAKVDTAVVLEGKQGLKKSTAVKVLCGPEWFTDEMPDPGTKDAAIAVAGVWFLELAELTGLKRAEVNTIKAFMSRATDRFRPPYAKRTIKVHRQCVFVGTSNDNQYLIDETGARRFWPVACTEIDIAGLSEDREQLWAEAATRYHRGETWWLDEKSVQLEAEEQQRERYQEDPWEPKIIEHLALLNSTSVSEILNDCIKKPLEQITQVDSNRVARCLKAVGWVRKKTGNSTGPRPYRYFRPD